MGYYIRPLKVPIHFRCGIVIFSLIFHFKIHYLSLPHTYTHTNTLPTLGCLITLRDGKIQDKETIDNITYLHSKVWETKFLNSQFVGIEPRKAWHDVIDWDSFINLCFLVSLNYLICINWLFEHTCPTSLVLYMTWVN